MRSLVALVLLLGTCANAFAQAPPPPQTCRQSIPNDDFNSCKIGENVECSSDFQCDGKKVGEQCNQGLIKICRAECEYIFSGACCSCAPESVICSVEVKDANNLTVTVQDPVDGIQSIGTYTAKNINVSIPAFSTGTFDPIIVTGSKIDPMLSARLELQVCTPTYCKICDPFLTLVARETGKPEIETFTEVPEAEHHVMIKNGSPGLKNLLILVNGARFRVSGLADDEELTLDISSAMLPGNQNVIELQAFGKPGTSATVMVHD